MVLEATPLLFTTVGLLLSELLKFVKDLRTKAAKFRSLLERLETTLKQLSPVFDDIERSKQELDQKENVLRELKELLAKGRGLVVKCRDNPHWNYWGRRRLSKKLRKYDEEIRRFCDLHLSLLTFRETINNTETLNNINRNLSNIPTSVWSVGSSCRLIGSCCDALELSEFTVGIDRPLKELKEILLKDTKTIHVSGAGGSGKTTLAKKLFHDPEVRGKYDKNKFFIEVKRTPVKKIIQELYQHKGYPDPEIQLDQDARGHLESLLTKLQPDPVLLILDDVSHDFPINTFVFETLDYKVLVTTRSTFPVPAACTYKLNLLNDKNSMELFCHYAFPEKGEPDFNDDDLVNQVVKKCQNNPLILKVIAGLLASQSLVMWNSLLKNWSETLRNSKNEQIDTLRFCVDALENGVLKDCFYDLACFPDDLRIPAAALIDMWVELYELDENDAMKNLLELSKRNLVDMMTTRKDAIEIHICFNDVFVTQHDNLKELAINPEQGKRLIIEIGKNELPLNLKEPAADVRLLSISTGHLDCTSSSTDEVSNENWCNMELHKVEALILNCRMKSYTLPNIMKGQLLKLLIVTNYGISPAELTNFLILGSLSNVRRIRFKNVIIPSIPEKMKHVKSLKKLSLVMCKMDQALKSSAVQFFDIFPELEELDIDYCSDIVEFPPLPCNFPRLKKLNITNCPKLTKMSEGIGQLGALEELNLQACSELTELPSSIGNLKNLIFLNISDCVSLTILPENVGELGSLTKIHMRGCTSLSELPESIRNLRNLRHVFGDEDRVALWNAKKSFYDNLQVHEVKENINLNWLLQ